LLVSCFFIDVDLCAGSLSIIGKNLNWDWGPNPFQVDWCKGTYGFSAHACALVCKQMHIKVFEVCSLYLQTSLFWLWKFLDFNSMFAKFIVFYLSWCWCYSNSNIWGGLLNFCVLKL
jgi:hypothetical protein